MTDIVLGENNISELQNARNFCLFEGDGIE